MADLLDEVARRVAEQIIGGPAARARIYGGAAKSQQLGYSQNEAEYTDTSSDEDNCGGCVHFSGMIYGGPEIDANAACRIVSGKVLPQGWCRFYYPRMEAEGEDEGE